MNRTCYLFLLFLMTSCAAYAAPVLMMPEELVDAATNRKCSMIEDFYNRPALEFPIFTKGKLGNDSEDSFVFWCKTNDEKMPYSLMIYPANPEGKYPCPLEIKWWNYPGGLYIDKVEYKLSEFQYLKNPSKSGPNISLNGNAIYGTYDGITEIFYCHEGEWLYKMLD
jgi:hypothetical protein